jgi:hypothetical protein
MFSVVALCAVDGIREARKRVPKALNVMHGALRLLLVPSKCASS